MREKSEIAPVSARLPTKLYETVKQRALGNRRSVNSELVVLLERALLPDQKNTAEAVATVPAE